IAIYMGLGTLALVVVNHVAGWVVEMSSSRSEEQHFIRFEDSCFTIDPLPSGCFYGVYVEVDDCSVARIAFSTRIHANCTMTGRTFTGLPYVVWRLSRTLVRGVPSS
ncbi:unnamed protein product, partial [Durusdinium trenchii]